MAYNNVKGLSFSEIQEKAKELGATHYYTHVLHDGSHFSHTFVVDHDENDLKEVAVLVTGMKSFNVVDRLCPKHLIGKKFYENKVAFTQIASVYAGMYTPLKELH